MQNFNLTVGNSSHSNLSEDDLERIKEEMKSLMANLDSMFLIVMGLLVFCLQAGFAFYESSCVRVKNVTDVLFRNYVDTCMSTLAYFLTGYGLSFGSGNGFWGYEYFGLIGLPDTKMAHCFFQYAFAACASTIVKGTVHERCTMSAYISYTLFTAGFVYPVAGHWAYSEQGWLHHMGFNDYAGSGVIHLLAGTSSLAASYMCGPRLNRFNSNGSPNTVHPQSIPQSALGSFIFMLGMTAFNVGSQGSISRPEDRKAISIVVINTMICVAASTVTALLFRRFVLVRMSNGWDFDHGANGSFVGMVVICSGVNQFPVWGALVVGVVSYFCYLSAALAIDKLKIDDPVGGLGVQIAGGYFGLIGVALFREGGLVYDRSSKVVKELLVNALGGLVVFCWAWTTTCALYVVLRYHNVHRASLADERMGLDLEVHKQRAYNFENFFPTTNVMPFESHQHNHFSLPESQLSENSGRNLDFLRRNGLILQYNRGLSNRRIRVGPAPPSSL